MHLFLLILLPSKSMKSWVLLHNPITILSKRIEIFARTQNIFIFNYCSKIFIFVVKVLLLEYYFLPKDGSCAQDIWTFVFLKNLSTSRHLISSWVLPWFYLIITLLLDLKVPNGFSLVLLWCWVLKLHKNKFNNTSF